MKKTNKGGKVLLVTAAVALAASAGIAATSNPVMKIARQQSLEADQTVGIAKGTDYKETTLKAVALAGGLESLIKPKGTVLIKPNVVGPSPSGAGRITDWRVVQAIVDKCLGLGAGKVIVGEGPVDKGAEFCFTTAGYKNIKGAEVVDLSIPREDCYYAQSVNALGMPLWIPKIYLDADTVIDISIMKTHDTAGVTMSLKNVGIGIPSLKALGTNAGWKEPLHFNGVNRTITDVNMIRRPDFSIVDGMVAGEGNGPVNPTAKRMNLVLAGRDPVAVDSVGTGIMGYDPDEITHIVYAAGMGIGTMDAGRIKVVGEDAKGLTSPFKKPDTAKTTPWPYRPTGIVTGTGDGNPWRITLGKEKQIRSGKDSWSGPKDFTGDFNLSTDGKGIFIRERITDDKVTEADSADYMFSIDNPFEEAGGQRTAYKKGKDFHFSTNIGVMGKEQPVYSTFPEKVVEKKAVAGAYSRVAPNGSGFTRETVIPLSGLGLTELPFGKEFWFDIVVNDTDGSADDTTKIIWSASTRSGKDPTSMGRVLVNKR